MSCRIVLSSVLLPTIPLPPLTERYERNPPTKMELCCNISAKFRFANSMHLDLRDECLWGATLIYSVFILSSQNVL